MQTLKSLKIKYRIFRNHLRSRVDSLVFYKTQRWLSFWALYSLLVLKILLTHKYYAVLYLLTFFFIQKIILYFTPQGIPSIIDEEENEMQEFYQIPENSQIQKQESKPVIRKLGEFYLWKSLVAMTLVGLLCTCVDILDIAVYWPLLVVYMAVIVLNLVVKQRRHMKKYEYTL